jgi:MFS transporter, ACS family, tartrate transporter
MCYLDRSNLAYAALQLNAALGFDAAVYGAGASAFFAGYVFCQVPSNAALVRWGARAWLPALVLAWGCVGTAFAGMRTAGQFYALRVALGVAEAGVFPALWVVLASFYGERDLGVAYTTASLGTSVAQVVGAPLAAALLALDGRLSGLAGWQCLFLLEGLPTLALGAWLAARLPDGPATAKFLTPDEKAFIAAREAREAAAKGWGDGGGGGGRPGPPSATTTTTAAGLAAAARDRRTWAVAGVAALESAAKNGLMYWSPLIIAGLVGDGSGGGSGHPAHPTTTTTRPVHTAAIGRRLAHLALPTSTPSTSASSASTVALLSALPFGLAAAAMAGCASHSQRSGERRAHIALPYAAGAACLAGMAAALGAGQPRAAFACLLGSAALWAPSGVLHTLPASFLAPGPPAATGIALINSISNVGGLVGPAALGALRARTGSHGAGLAALAAGVAAAAVLAWVALPADPPVVVATGVPVVVVASSSLSAGGDEEEAAAPQPPPSAGPSAVARRRGWWWGDGAGR